MRRRTLIFGGCATLVALGLACSKDFVEEQPIAGDGGFLEDSATTIPPQADTGVKDNPAGTGLGTGLPCDVQAVLEDRCIACHSNASPPSLLNYSDLVAPSISDPKKTRAVLSLERMKSATSPMPPKPAVPPDADEILVFEEWVKAGLPRNPKACTDPPPSTDGGDGGMVPIPDGGGDGGLVCTSGKTWVLGNQKSELMHPGMACNACHQQLGGPNLRIGGTVYPTVREPDDCYGSAPPPPIDVVVTDDRGKVFTMPVNGTGNFLLYDKVKPPYRAEVRVGNAVRKMAGSVTSGDCNSCHTVTGKNGAPGRILKP